MLKPMDWLQIIPLYVIKSKIYCLCTDSGKLSESYEWHIGFRHKTEFHPRNQYHWMDEVGISIKSFVYSDLHDLRFLIAKFRHDRHAHL